MFGIGMPELLLILAVALVVIGPKKLPDLAKSLGRAMGEFKRATNDLKQSIEQETGLDEVRQSMKEVNRDIRRSFDSADTQPATTGAETTENIKDVPPDEKDSDRDKIDPAVAGEATEEIQRTPDAEKPAKSKEDDAR